MAKQMRDNCKSCPVTCEGKPSKEAQEYLMALYCRKTKDKAPPDIEIGCQWAINSAEFNFCFWEFAKTLDAPMTNQQIASMLGMTVQGVKAEFDSAIQKLKDIKHSPIIQEFASLVGELEKSDPTQPGIPTQELQEYLEKLRQFHENSDSSQVEEWEQEKKKPRKRHSLPVHRDGKKVDLYGIYSDATRERMAKEGKKTDDRKKK